MARTLPFSNLSAREWHNLGLSAVFVFYLLLFWWGFASGGLFLGLGGDYRSYWSAGYIARTHGFAHAYDLASLAKVQATMLPPPYNQDLFPLPMFFLPTFLLPFCLLSYMEPSLSFVVWTLLNSVIICTYTLFLLRSWGENAFSPRLYVLLLLFFPVFNALFWGTANVWLLIAVGEFVRHGWNGRPFQAGAWLGTMLLKPQALVLLLPALLFQQAWKAVSGFLLVGGLLIGSSWLAIGTRGMVNLLHLWLGLP
jgi:hypothetical protein